MGFLQVSHGILDSKGHQPMSFLLGSFPRIFYKSSHYFLAHSHEISLENRLDKKDSFSNNSTREREKKEGDDP